MAKSARSSNSSRHPKTAKGTRGRSTTRNSRTTVSGPAKPDASGGGDPAAEKATATQDVSAAFTFNPNKAAEYDPAAALSPPEGASVKPSDPIAGASTVSELNGSDKAGSGGPNIGQNPAAGPLDRVRVDSTGRALTTNQGVPVGDNQSSLKAGLRGPTLLEDFILREKITHFDHERIPERIVHARGSAAHGFFECTKALTDVTRASLFAEVGKQTPVFVRFSTVLGERGSTDTARDVRGFAVKFYTDEGKNRNPDNFFAETEQVAFCVAHVVPGIDFSNDPLLAGRIHSYVDTQISRLGGPNFHELPINAPIAQVHNNQRDGMHRQAIHRGRVSYEPNSLGGGCPFQAGAKGFVSFPEPREASDHKVRGKAERFADHYTQATLFWNSQSNVEKQHIINAFRFELSRVQTPAVRERMVSGLLNVARELAEPVAAGLGICDLPEPMPKVLTRDITPEVAASPALSLFARPGDGSIRTRRVAIVVADGCDGEAMTAIANRLTNEGAVPRFVSTTLGPVQPASGDAIEVDVSLEAAPAVLYDALVLPSGADAVTTLRGDGRTLEFIKDQYRHCKPILALGESAELLQACGIESTLPDGQADPGVLVASDAAPVIGDLVAAIARHRHFARETDPPRV
jgi:hypothetical protein